LAFNVYNVLVSLLNVPLGEPRDGVWRMLRAATVGEMTVPLGLEFAAGVAATALVARYVWVRRHAWRIRAFTRGDQLVILFLLVLAANAALCYAYTKDVILSPAGVFFAAAVFVACSDLVDVPGRSRRAAAGATVVLAVVSSLWAVRFLGVHAGLHQMGHEVRDQWAYVDDFLQRRNISILTPRQRAVTDRLQNDALRRHPAVVRDEWLRMVGGPTP
jgi:hypothetical protein